MSVPKLGTIFIPKLIQTDAVFSELIQCEQPKNQIFPLYNINTKAVRSALPLAFWVGICVAIYAAFTITIFFAALFRHSAEDEGSKGR